MSVTSLAAFVLDGSERGGWLGAGAVEAKNIKRKTGDNDLKALRCRGRGRGAQRLGAASTGRHRTAVEQQRVRRGERCSRTGRRAASKQRGGQRHRGLVTQRALAGRRCSLLAAAGTPGGDECTKRVSSRLCSALDVGSDICCAHLAGLECGARQMCAVGCPARANVPLCWLRAATGGVRARCSRVSE